MKTYFNEVRNRLIGWSVSDEKPHVLVGNLRRCRADDLLSHVTAHLGWLIAET